MAETHLHVGAAVSFGLLWTSLVGSLAHRPPDPKALARGGSPPFGDGLRFLCVLQAAAITRLVLASFLWRHELRGSPRSFGEFLAREHGGLPAIARRTAFPWGADAFLLRACRGALGVAVTGEAHLSAATLASVHRHLLARARFSASKTLGDLLHADPLAVWLVPAQGLALPETRFSARGIRYLRSQGHTDEAFARAFWQYQRIRMLTYRHLTFEPGTSGLDWFQQHYSRISPLRAGLDGARFESAVHLCARGTQLASIETRTAPEPAWHIIRDLVRHAAVPRIAASSRPEVGLVLHLLDQGAVQNDTLYSAHQHRVCHRGRARS